MADNVVLVNAINNAIDEAMAEDKNVYMMAESTHGTVFGIGGPQILSKYGDERFLDVPIAEKGYANIAIGSALTGKRPIIDLMFGDFTGITFHELVQEAPAIHYISGGQFSCPVTFIAVQGAGIGGGCHHSANVEGWFMNAPGLKVVCPSTADDAYGLMKAAIADNNPVLVLAHKLQLATSGPVPEGYTVPIGKSKIVKEGSDVTIIAGQHMLDHAMEAVQELEAEGISVEVIDPRSLRPFDREGFAASAKKTGRVLIVTEHPVCGGVSAEFAAAITEDCFNELKAPVARLGQAETVIPHAQEENFIFPSTASIKACVEQLVKA